MARRRGFEGTAFCALSVQAGAFAGFLRARMAVPDDTRARFLRALAAAEAAGPDEAYPAEAGLLAVARMARDLPRDPSIAPELGGLLMLAASLVDRDMRSTAAPPVRQGWEDRADLK